MNMKFKIVMEKGEDGYYVVTVPSLPGCISQGKTEEEAKKNIKEAIELHIESLAEDGIPIIKKKDTKEYEIQVSL
jgi:predicted RNase H-like HicB family nuclease